MSLPLLVASPSPLAPAGDEARHLATTWWILLAAGGGTAVLVIAMVLVSLFRRPDDRPDAEAGHPFPAARKFIVGGGVIYPAVVLALVGVLTVVTTTSIRRHEPDALPVHITGVQWFWRIDYPGTGVHTANQMVLPAGRPVTLRITSEDVIHSVWMPQLAGKVDAIPGQPNTLRFTPEKPGTYRGECAEFCGLEHAWMNFTVIVVPPARFRQWLDDHRAPPPAPTSAAARAGRALFAASSCAGCHTVQGLTHGTVGPDLTDVASRPDLGAGVLSNDPRNLNAWVHDPGRFKPGVHMPPTELTDQQIAQIVAYLETLR